eukprot:597588-Pelagomonas_calceolata.AAC.2
MPPCLAVSVCNPLYLRGRATVLNGSHLMCMGGNTIQSWLSGMPAEGGLQVPHICMGPNAYMLPSCEWAAHMEMHGGMPTSQGLHTTLMCIGPDAYMLPSCAWAAHMKVLHGIPT